MTVEENTKNSSISKYMGGFGFCVRGGLGVVFLNFVYVCFPSMHKVYQLNLTV